jgi:catechol 2,3-dioxygenase-like lactoylglutathione lyase family enzyme
MAEPAQPAERMVVGHFIVSDDVERSRRFYTEVLGGRVVFGPEPTNVALANSFIIIINVGGGPTDDKPTVTLERRQATPTGSAASSISGSQTSTPFTPNGALGARSS